MNTFMQSTSSGTLFGITHKGHRALAIKVDEESRAIFLGTEDSNANIYGIKRLSGAIRSKTVINCNDYRPTSSNRCVIGNFGDASNPGDVVLRIQNGGATDQEIIDPSKIIIDFLNNGRIRTTNLPTSSAGLNSGEWYLDSQNHITVVP